MKGLLLTFTCVYLRLFAFIDVYCRLRGQKFALWLYFCTTHRPTLDDRPGSVGAHPALISVTLNRNEAPSPCRLPAIPRSSTRSSSSPAAGRASARRWSKLS